MSESNPLFIKHFIHDLSKKIQDLYKRKKFDKISEEITKLTSQLSPANASLNNEDMSLLYETCLKCSKFLIKQRNFFHSLISTVSDFIIKYSNSTQFICLNQINHSKLLISQGKPSEAKRLIKSALNSLDILSNYSDIIPKLKLTLSYIYLKQPGKHEKSLKLSQNALDESIDKISTSREDNYFKFVVEALYLKGLYYTKTLDFFQAESMLDQAKELAGKRKICKHLLECLRRLERDILFLSSKNKANKNYQAKQLSYGSMELTNIHTSKNIKFFTNAPFKILEKTVISSFSKFLGAVKIQSLIRMFIARKRYLRIREMKVIKCVKKTVDGTEYVISGCVNRENDVIVKAFPLSGLESPSEFLIENRFRASYGLQNNESLCGLLPWVCIIGNRVFVPHQMNRRRLIYKRSDNLSSEFLFNVKVFECSDQLIVQASRIETYEIIIEKKSVPVEHYLSPVLLVMKIKFDVNKLIYLK